MAWGIALKLPEWSHSLQFRLVLGFAALLSICLFGVSVWAAYDTRNAIKEYRRDTEYFRDERARQLLQEVYDYNQNMDHVQESVLQIAMLFSQRVAVVDSRGFVVADSHDFPTDLQGNYQKEHDRFSQYTQVRTVPLSLGPNVVGKVVFIHTTRTLKPQIKFWVDNPSYKRPHPMQQRQMPAETNGADAPEVMLQTDYVESDEDRAALTLLDEAMSTLSAEPQLSTLQDEFQQSLIVSGIAGGVAGILMLIFFTRRAFAPMRRLTTAAERVGRGQLDQRVETDSRGEIGQLANTFNAMASELETVEARRRLLTADIAHELRTPLTNIRGYLEAIKDDVVKPEEETIEIIYQETLHLTTLVEDLRLLAIADAGALQLDLLPDRVDSIAESVAAAFQPRAKESDIELVCQIGHAIPLVDVDRTRMTQVIHNLVENAIAHSPRHGKVEIRVQNRDDENGIEISVSDNGNGISADEIENIFDQFYRVDSARARSTGGAGLGLTIVKRLVEAHGGEISVQSEVDQGASFTIFLPGSETVEATD